MHQLALIFEKEETHIRDNALDRVAFARYYQG